MDNYLSFVKGTCLDKWHVNFEDLNVGMKLFTKLAVEEANESKQVIRSKNEPFTLLEIIKRKVENFVERHFLSFKSICETGFPFSMLESFKCEVALKRSLESYDSVLTHFMMQNDSIWLTEEELNKSFGEPFKRIEFSEINFACFDLEIMYQHNANQKAGYYLLWLIKQEAETNFQIPPKETFNISAVKDVLLQFIRSEGSKFTPRFIEIIAYSAGRKCLYEEISGLNKLVNWEFFDFIESQCKDIPLNKWPRKKLIIVDILHTKGYEEKISVARELKFSPDEDTSRLGSHLLSALTTANLKLVIPRFNALIELLPGLNPKKAFDLPFGEFWCDKYEENPKFTRRLNFDSKQIFVHGDLIIGKYNTTTVGGRYKSGKFLEPCLVAYNMETERVVWSVPLIPDEYLNSFKETGIEIVRYSLNRIGDNIILSEGSRNISFVRLDDGEVDFELLMPWEVIKMDMLHISPSGFFYQIKTTDVGCKIIGGEIIDKKCKISFEVETQEEGEFIPLSTHVGVYDEIIGKLVVFGPSGNHVTIENCLSVQAIEDKLYLIEQNPAKENECLLTVRSMTYDEKVLSEAENGVFIGAIDPSYEKLSLGRLCDNGQWILFKNYYAFPGKKAVIFANLSNGEVLYSIHKTSLNVDQVINTSSAELWSKDEISRKIWKISSKEVSLMRHLSSCKWLIHVDKRDHLYFL